MGKKEHKESSSSASPPGLWCAEQQGRLCHTGDVSVLEAVWQAQSWCSVLLQGPGQPGAERFVPGSEAAPLGAPLLILKSWSPVLGRRRA